MNDLRKTSVITPKCVYCKKSIFVIDCEILIFYITQISINPT